MKKLIALRNPKRNYVNYDLFIGLRFGIPRQTSYLIFLFVYSTLEKVFARTVLNLLMYFYYTDFVKSELYEYSDFLPKVEQQIIRMHRELNIRKIKLCIQIFPRNF